MKWWGEGWGRSRSSAGATLDPKQSAPAATGDDYLALLQESNHLDSTLDSEIISANNASSCPSLFSVLQRGNNTSQNALLSLNHQAPQNVSEDRDDQVSSDEASGQSSRGFDTSKSYDGDSIANGDEFECLLPGNEKYFDVDIMTIWKQRRIRERNRVFSTPLYYLWGDSTGGCNQERPSHPDTFLHAAPETNSVRFEAGGGCNEENLRALELESHLQALRRPNDMKDMEVMLAEEKEREDLLYDEWMQSMYELDMDEEPEFGYDNLGWYESLTNCDNGEDNLELDQSLKMDVLTTKDIDYDNHPKQSEHNMDDKIVDYHIIDTNDGGETGKNEEKLLNNYKFGWIQRIFRRNARIGTASPDDGSCSSCE